MVPSPPVQSVETDALDVGWGYQSSWGHQACRDRVEERWTLHIILRELMVVKELLCQPWTGQLECLL